MEAAIWIINLIGLMVTTGAAVLIFMGTPFDTGGILEFSFGDDERDRKTNEIRKRMQLSRTGFILLICGFAVQVISAILQYPS